MLEPREDESVNVSTSGGTITPVGAPNSPRIYQPQSEQRLKNGSRTQQIYPPTSANTKTLSDEKSPNDDKIDLILEG